MLCQAHKYFHYSYTLSRKALRRELIACVSSAFSRLQSTRKTRFIVHGANLYPRSPDLALATTRGASEDLGL